MERESREIWEKRVERWRDSGLSVKEFAREVGVNPHTLAGWRWRLKAESSEPDTASTPRDKATPTHVVVDEMENEGSSRRSGLRKRRVFFGKRGKTL